MVVAFAAVAVLKAELSSSVVLAAVASAADIAQMVISLLMLRSCLLLHFVFSQAPHYNDFDYQIRLAEQEQQQENTSGTQDRQQQQQQQNISHGDHS